MRLLFPLLAALTLPAADWSKPVEIFVDDVVCAAYKARVDAAGNLLVHVTLGDGWHTFAMDNTVRANEKLAGRKAIGMDKPTSFTVTGGLAVEGPWRQPALTDFSKPELRIFSWGFEKQALFAAKVKATGAPKAQVNVQGQACTPAICKNIQTTLEIDLVPPAKAPEPGLDTLTAIRTQ